MELKENREFIKFFDQERKKQVYEAMDEQQKERFESYRQTSFSDLKLKKILSLILSSTAKL